MNRREALLAMLSLPATTRISRAELKPADVIVIECQHHITQEQAHHVAERVKKVLSREVVVLSGGLRMKVMERKD